MLRISNGTDQQRESVDLAIAYLEQLTNKKTGIGSGTDEMDLMNKISLHQTRENQLPIDLEKVISRKMKRQNEAGIAIKGIEGLIE